MLTERRGRVFRCENATATYAIVVVDVVPFDVFGDSLELVINEAKRIMTASFTPQKRVKKEIFRRFSVSALADDPSILWGRYGLGFSVYVCVHVYCVHVCMCACVCVS